MARTVRTIAEVSDDLTGAIVPEDSVTDFKFAFGDVAGTVTLTAESELALRELPQFAALVKAASASKTTGGSHSSGPSTDLYPGTNVTSIVLRKEAQRINGTTAEGKPVPKSARLALSADTLAAIVGPNGTHPEWAAGYVAPVATDATDAKTDAKAAPKK